MTYTKDSEHFQKNTFDDVSTESDLFTIEKFQSFFDLPI